jgi:cystathionine gamma-lyase/cystathionine beta-lyase/cystathionine gamma-lyase/homocysteine desulfhydrase
VFASGMAAINAITSMLKAGDHVVAGHNLYGGTPRLFNQVLANFGLTFTYVDTSNLKKVRSAFQKNTRLLFLETPTNPLMELCDLRAICELSHRHDVEVVVDNTFMSPYFQRPIKLGADMVVHSTTKFLNGHSDGLGGVVVCTKPEQAEKLAFLQKCAGAILCAWSNTIAAAAKSPTIFQNIRKYKRFFIRGCPIIRTTNSRSARCQASDR